uniref:Uncharacterized protein n=1 Tax=uncultured organism TaxID=155900 RepID=A0A0G2YN74_9ZZZZ|nr:hypothetical protein [uncultured organism]
MPSTSKIQRFIGVLLSGACDSHGYHGRVPVHAKSSHEPAHGCSRVTYVTAERAGGAGKGDGDAGNRCAGGLADGERAGRTTGRHQVRCRPAASARSVVAGS